jgi:hypothetical protein
MTGVSISCGLAWVFTASAVDAGAQRAPVDPAVPTAIEEAIIEHACGSLHPAGALETDAYLECRSRQLTSLRDDFGRDLRRLSSAERRTIDAACTSLRASQGQDAYVECLTAHLAPLRGRGNRPAPDAAGAAVATAPPSPAPPPVEAPPAGPPASRVSGVWIAAALVAVTVAAAGGAFVTVSTRRKFGACRTCGVKLLERGDLCQKCRHEAADALRRATAERAEQARAQEDEQRRQAAKEAEQQQLAREEEARRLQREEAQREQARQEEERAQRQRDDEARQQRQVEPGAPRDEADPYVVLGLPEDASAADVETAYKAVRSKFDLDLVADMGVELQEHMKRKAEAVERAYETLVARRAQ